MDVVLMGLKDIYALVYFDDVLLFSDSIQEHAQGVRMVLDRILEAKLKLNQEKYIFAARELTYLGHLVSANCVSADAGKVNAI
jgi:hypothetical protein